MQNGIVFNAARTLALASIVGAPLTALSARLAAAPQASPPPPQPIGASGDPAEAVIALINELWMQAWSIPFDPGSMSVQLVEQPAGGDWLAVAVDAAAAEPVLAEGVFVEAARRPLDMLAWSPVLLEQAGLTAADQWAVAGTLEGSSGAPIPVAAMVREVHAAGPDGQDVVTRVLTPFALPADLEAALQEMDLFWAPPGALPPMLTAGPNHPPFTPGGGFPAAYDDHGNVCLDVHLLCIDACAQEAAARNTVCTAAAAACAAACALGCATTTIGYGICLAICLGGCLAVELACLIASDLQFKACLTNCLIDRLLCEANQP